MRAASEKRAATVCGMQAISLNLGADIDIAILEKTLSKEYATKVNPHFLSAKHGGGGHKFSVFSHGRVVLEGSEDEKLLRTFVSRYLGA